MELHLFLKTLETGVLEVFRQNFSSEVVDVLDDERVVTPQFEVARVR